MTQGDLQTLFKTSLVDRINVVHRNEHPHALVGGIVAVRAKRHLEVTLAAASLGVQAQEHCTMKGSVQR